MSKSRRQFLQSAAAVAAGFAAAPPTLKPQAAPAPPATAPATVQVPRMKFGPAQISRLVLGVNPLYGFAHYNGNFGRSMAEWYTQDQVCETLHRANAFGINAFNYVNIGRARRIWLAFSPKADGCTSSSRPRRMTTKPPS